MRKIKSKMSSNIIFTIVLLLLTVFFALVVFRTHAFKHLKAWTIIAFAFLVGGIFLVGVISKQEITKDEDEISVLVRLLHSEIDKIESISASNQKSEYIKQSDIVLNKIDSIALHIKEEEAYTDINIDKRIAKIREIVNESKSLVETLNDTIYIRDLVIDNQYEVTDEEMNIQKLPLSNKSNFSFLLKIYDENLRERAKAIYIISTTNPSVGKTYQYKNKQNHFVLPYFSQNTKLSYRIGILTYNENRKTYTYYYINV